MTSSSIQIESTVRHNENLCILSEVAFKQVERAHIVFSFRRLRRLFYHKLLFIRENGKNIKTLMQLDSTKHTVDLSHCNE